jgi:hypothetical protein
VPINYLAVFAAAASTFLIGGLWYSPLLFQRAWMRANNLTENDLRTGGQAKIFGLAFVFALVMALNLAMLLNAPDTTTTWRSALARSRSSSVAHLPTRRSTAGTGSSHSSSWARFWGPGGDDRPERFAPRRLRMTMTLPR